MYGIRLGVEAGMPWPTRAQKGRPGAPPPPPPEAVPSRPVRCARPQARQLPGPRAHYLTGEAPDVWFAAEEVWEMRGAELTIRPAARPPFGSKNVGKLKHSKV